jgi:hypothetical protein
MKGLIFLASSLSQGEGFGLNGNILETNIINLSVVVAIVVSFGGTRYAPFRKSSAIDPYHPSGSGSKS